MHDRSKGSVYAFVGCVVSRVIAGTQGMSVALEGTPKQTKVASNSSGVWRSAEEEQQQGSGAKPLPGKPAAGTAGTGTIPGMPSRKQRGGR